MHGNNLLQPKSKAVHSGSNLKYQLFRQIKVMLKFKDSNYPESLEKTALKEL
jgi:hypothetical protein